MTVCAAFYNRPPVPLYKVDADVWNEEGLGKYYYTAVQCACQRLVINVLDVTTCHELVPLCVYTVYSHQCVQQQQQLQYEFEN